MWKIKKEVRKGDYLYAVVLGHPKATNRGYVLYHRIIMENHIGRSLVSTEVVHHRDGNKHNNKISNLELMDAIEHRRLHSIKYPEGHKVKLVCSYCRTHFWRDFRNRPEIKKSANTFCSRSCMGKFYYSNGFGR